MIVQIVTAVTAMVKLANAIKDYQAEDTNEEVLERIELMQEALDSQLDQIGQSITELTGLIESEFDAFKLETAISLSQTAMNLLYSYRDLNLTEALVEADAASSQSVELLKQQNEVFFIGGLLLAGNVRIDVIRALDPEFASDEWRIQEINALASHLESLLLKIEQQVPTNHYVTSWQNIESMEHLLGYRETEPGVNVPPRVTNEMAHRHNGSMINSYPYSCSGAGCAMIQIYTQQESTDLANASREQGIQNELASLAVPEMREVLSIWRNLVVQQQTGFAMWKLLGRKLNMLDAQRIQRPYLSVTREAVRRTPRSGEASGKVAYEMALNIDARPFIVDILTSLEFRTRSLQKRDREGIYGEMLNLLFGRKPSKDEIVNLRRIEDQLGYEGMVAGLVHGREYAERYGTNVPMQSTANRTVPRSRKRKQELATSGE